MLPQLTEWYIRAILRDCAENSYPAFPIFQQLPQRQFRFDFALQVKCALSVGEPNVGPSAARPGRPAVNVASPFFCVGRRTM